MRKVTASTGLAMAIALSAVAVVLITSRAPKAHTVYATFASAINIVSGARVQVAGTQAGTVGAIDVRAGQAQVALKITDDRFWPLRRGTEAQIRWGGTVSYANRYIELTPSADGPSLPNGSHLPPANSLTPVELSQLFDTFDRPTRANLGKLIDETSHTFGPNGGALAAGLRAGAPALRETAQAVSRLSADPAAMRVLVSSAATTAQAIARRTPALRRLVRDYGATVTTIAAQSGDVRRTLAAMPSTLATLQTATTRLTPVLRRTQSLVTSLGPGARALRAIAPLVTTATHAVTEVAPKLDSALASVQKGGPAITKLLRQATPLARSLPATLDRTTPILACLRAFTPEIGSLGVLWSSLYENYDATGHHGRVDLSAYSFGDKTSNTPSQLVAQDPNLVDAWLPPPGFAAFQPWYIPECGVTADGVDATKDPYRP
jgi:virulence factor Mce-like protein